MYMWGITLEDYMEVIKLAKARGKKEGDSIEEEFLFIMKLKGINPICKTDKTIEELKEDFIRKGLKALDLRKYLNKGDSDEKTGE